MLLDAEAALVAAAIVVMLDSFDERLGEDDDDEMAEPTADMQLGIAVFDSLTIPQRIATLHHVSKHLLTDASPEFEDTCAIDDATIAAIFSEIQDQVMIEIGLDPDEFITRDSPSLPIAASTLKMTYWRSLVVAAYDHVVSGDGPLTDAEVQDDVVMLDPMETSYDVWDDAIDALASAILWDRDFELADGFMDEDPSSARQRRKLLGIPDNYFIKAPLDPTINQTKVLLAQAKSLASRRPR